MFPKVKYIIIVKDQLPIFAYTTYSNSDDVSLSSVITLVNILKNRIVENVTNEVRIDFQNMEILEKKNSRLNMDFILVYEKENDAEKDIAKKILDSIERFFIALYGEILEKSNLQAGRIFFRGFKLVVNQILLFHKLNIITPEETKKIKDRLRSHITFETQNLKTDNSYMVTIELINKYEKTLYLFGIRNMVPPGTDVECDLGAIEVVNDTVKFNQYVILSPNDLVRLVFLIKPKMIFPTWTVTPTLIVGLDSTDASNIIQVPLGTFRVSVMQETKNNEKEINKRGDS